MLQLQNIVQLKLQGAITIGGRAEVLLLLACGLPQAVMCLP